MKKWIFTLAFFLLTNFCSADIIVVDDDWPYDFNNIQAAITYSSSGDYIFVFPGTYTGAGNYNIDFLGKAVTVRSIDPMDPYIVAQTIIDCNHLGHGFIFSSGEDANSILTGFTITNARTAIRCSYGSPVITNCIVSNNSDSGIYCRNCSPIITNCTITDNTGYGPGAGSGGGIFCDMYSDPNSPIITDCIISGNSANRGGGIYCYYYARPIVSNCIITGNSAQFEGGGIYCNDKSNYEYTSVTMITNCNISANTAETGGGIYCTGTVDPNITNCIITGNRSFSGGGFYCDSEHGPEIVNCTITGNLAKHEGGGIYCTYTLPAMNGCIVWANANIDGPVEFAQICYYDDYYLESDTSSVWFSCIQDVNQDDANIPCGEEQFNIDDDPCFVEPGCWVDANDPNIIVEPNDPNAVWLDGDYHLLFASPCIEAGDPYYTYHIGDVDMDAQPRLMGQYVDMGADEFELSIIIVTEPQSGDVWIAGSTREIKWASYDVTGTVDISYSDNNGADWVMINNVPDTGSFFWIVPGAVDSSQCLVSVEPNVPVPNLIRTQGGPFTIHPDFTGPPVISKWKSLGGDFNRTGLSQDPGPELGCVKWQFQTAGPVSASPSIGAPGRVHLPCEDGKLYKLNAEGQLLWSYDTNSPLLSSPSVGLDGAVFVGAENGKLYAIDVYGNLRWTHSTGGSIYSSPAISADGNIFVCSQDGTLYALAQDGSKLWTFEIAGSGTVTSAVFASPAIGPDGTVYISGLYDPNLYALDPNAGSVKWTCTFLDPCEPNSYQLQPFASPVVAPDGTIYQALIFNPMRFINYTRDSSFWYDSRLYAIDSNNGNIIWSTNMTETAKQDEQENPLPPEPNYWFKQYYFNADIDYFPYPYPYTFTDLFIPDILRYYRVSNANWSEPALAPDGTIYVSFDDQYLRAVDPNGSIKWVTSLGWGGGFKLTVGSDGLIYAACNDGWLYVVDPNGKETARLESGTWLGYPVIPGNGTIIIADSNNTVSAVSSDGCEGKSAVLHRLEDLNSDWSVNLIDFAVVADIWFECTDTSYDPLTGTAYCDYDGDEAFLAGDINRDQFVNIPDLTALANQWLIED